MAKRTMKRRGGLGFTPERHDRWAEAAAKGVKQASDRVMSALAAGDCRRAFDSVRMANQQIGKVSAHIESGETSSAKQTLLDPALSAAKRANDAFVRTCPLNKVVTLDQAKASAPGKVIGIHERKPALEGLRRRRRGPRTLPKRCAGGKFCPKKR